MIASGERELRLGDSAGFGSAGWEWFSGHGASVSHAVTDAKPLQPGVLVPARSISSAFVTRRSRVSSFLASAIQRAYS